MQCIINDTHIEDGMTVWCCIQHCKEHIENKSKKRKLSKSDQ